MTADLEQFLSRHRRVSRNTMKWGGGIELEVTGYLSSEAPPPGLVSSIRAIVLREDCALVMENLDGTHIIPGGRVEEGETHEDTLKRELLEEAGVEIEVIAQIGFVHLRHTTPKPQDYLYPYPDFLWPVYSAYFECWRHDAKAEDDYEKSSRFLPFQEIRGLALERYEKVFLEAAISRRIRVKVD